MDDIICDLWQRNRNEVIIKMASSSHNSHNSHPSSFLGQKAFRAIEDVEPLKVSLKMATGYPGRHGRRKARPAPFR